MEKLPDWLIKEANEQKAPDPVYYLGDMIIQFQKVESLMIDLLSELIGKKEYAEAIGAELSFKRLPNLIESIMHINEIEDDLINKFTDIKVLITQIEEDRNRYVHSYYEVYEWGNDGIKYMRYKSKNKNGLKKTSEVFKYNDILEKTYEKIATATINIIDITIEIESRNRRTIAST